MLLVVGYFVCGFHVAFVGGHLPAYISDKGIGLSLFGITLSPAELGGWAIGMVGLFNIAGAILWSAMGNRHKRKNLLSLLYLLRSLVFLGFVLAPLSAASVLIFAGALGFLWLGTVPLTTSLVGYIFGPVHLTMLNGFAFFGHQVGSFFGGWGGGRLFDLQGNYDMMWWISRSASSRPRCTTRSSRSGSRGRPPRCRSRHEHELAHVFHVGRRRPGGDRDHRVVRPVGAERRGLSRRPDRDLLPVILFLL